jgi:alpha-tubulin suppressor-like RCC1 family protein
MQPASRSSRGAQYGLTIALLTVIASNAQADCTPPIPVSGDTVVWDWGQDVGDPTNTKRLSPVRLPLSGVTAVAAGYGYSLVLKNDSSVWAWGDNFFGTLGDGTTNPARKWDEPVRVVALAGVTRITASSTHSLALKSDGTVRAWGANFNGQLGDGTIDNSNIPVEVLNFSGVTAVAAGETHSLSLKSDGTVWAWGGNSNGQLGDGTFIERHTPVEVVNLGGVTCISADETHSLALKSDGTVWAWGSNLYGQLGDGTTTGHPTPVRVQNLTGVIAVASGSLYNLALKNDGTVWSWGRNASGQLGDGTLIDRHTPVKVKDLTGIMAIAAHYDHNLVLRTIGPFSGGVVRAWGANFSGELGDGTTNSAVSPVTVSAPSLNDVLSIAVGEVHSLALSTARPYLNIRNILVHPDIHKRRLFNLRIDGVVVRANDNGGNSGFQVVSPATHTVSETGSTGTPIGAFGVVIGGDCAADGTVNLAPADQKLCTITNYDHEGGCLDKGSKKSICCEPGDGAQGCLVCSKPGQGCPGQ